MNPGPSGAGPAHRYPELGAYYIRGCLQGAVRKGFDPCRLLEAAGIDPSAYTDPQARIDGEQMQRLLLAIRRTLHDEYLGFMEVPSKPELTHMVGIAAVKCKTLGQSLLKLVKFVNAVRSDIVLQLDAGPDDTVVLSFRCSGYAQGVEPHAYAWIALFKIYKFLCWLVGQRIRLGSVGTSSSRPPDVVDDRALFGCTMEFDQPCSYLSFRSDCLSAPVIRKEVELRQTDFAFGDTNWFSIPGSDQSLASRVEQMLIDHYRTGGGSIKLDVLGEVFHCSPRTLSRKLQKEGASFQEIKDRVRCELAQRFLSTTRLSIADIAARVGFSEPADFTRAFLTWTGRTPSEARRG